MHRLLSVRASVILVVFWAFAQSANADPIFSIKSIYSDIMPTSGSGESVKFTLSQGVVNDPAGIGPSISNLVIQFDTGALTSVQTDETDPNELVIGSDATFDLSLAKLSYDPVDHIIDLRFILLASAVSEDFDSLGFAIFQIEFLTGFTFTPKTGVPNWDTDKEEIQVAAEIFVPEPISVGLWMVLGGLALCGRRWQQRRRNALAAHRAS